MSFEMHLPTLAAGETLYSWCGTAHMHSGYASVRFTSQQIFGNDHAGRRHDFPSHLRAFDQRTCGVFGDPRTLALGHTLLGFYLAFRTGADADQILQGVVSGSVPDIKMQLGLPASRLGGYHPMRFCSQCTKEDCERIGWSVWHIEHQWPTSLVCRRHARPLVQLWHPITPVHRRKWLRPTAVDGEGAEELKIADDTSMRAALVLADHASHAARLATGAIDPRKVAGVLRGWAQERSCLTECGSVRYARLLPLIEPVGHYLVEALAAVPRVGLRLDLSSILANSLSRSPSPTHPLKVLVLRSAMFDTWDRFWETYGPDKAAAPSTTEPPVEPVAARSGEHELLQNQRFLDLMRGGNSVRSGAAAVGVSTGTGVRWARQAGIPVASRPKKLNATIMAQIRASLQEGDDRADIAAKYGVSLASIHRVLSTDHALRDAWASVRHEAARKANRSAVEGVLGLMPSVTSSQLRRAAPGAWAWLYRNDRDWLINSLPSLWKPIA